MQVSSQKVALQTNTTVLYFCVAMTDFRNQCIAHIQMLGEITSYSQSIMTATCINLNQTLVHQNAYCNHPRYVLNQYSTDEVCRNLTKYVEEGWPVKWRLPGTLQQYWQYQAQITVEHGILYFGTRLLIPSSLRLETLDLIHEGHQGITKCRRCAMSSVWWPGLSRQIEHLVSQQGVHSI